MEVDAFQGAPGIYSARFAGENVTYQDNVRKLLSVMEGVPKQDRTARFRTVSVLIDVNKREWTEGTIEGLITFEERGEKGFGYDPIFEVEDYGKTFSEIAIDEKNQISHRAQALKKMYDKLVTIFGKKGG